MKNQSMAKMVKAAGDSRVAMKMKKESAMKLKEKSPMEKELVGKQGNLPPELKAKIEAAPSKMKKATGKADKRISDKLTKDKLTKNFSGDKRPGKATGKAADKKGPMTMKSAMKKDLPEVRVTGGKEKEEDYNPDGTINKNSKRYKDAVAAAKRKKENEKKQKALDDKVKSGVDLSSAERAQLASQDKNKTTYFTGKAKKDKEGDSAAPMKRKTQVDGEQVTASKASGGMFMKKPMKMKKK